MTAPKNLCMRFPPIMALALVAWSCGLVVAKAEPLDNWSLRNSTLAAAGSYHVTFGNGLYVAVGDFGRIVASPDGANWSAPESGTFNSLFGVTYGGGRFVAAGEFGEILTSPDGLSWTTRFAETFNTLKSVAYGDGIYVAVGDNAQIVRSTDGVAWEDVASGSRYELFAVCHGNGRFVAGGEGGFILTSTDGLNWVRRAVPPGSDSINDITFAAGLFVAVGNQGGILTSADGITWSRQESGTSQNRQLFGIARNDSTFVVVGDTGLVLSSSNGTNWAEEVSGTAAHLYSASFGASGFLVVSYQGTVLTSSNGKDWVNPSAITESNLYGVTYGAGMFVAVGGGGAVLTSTNGATWEMHGIHPNYRLLSVAYGNGVFVAVGGTAVLVSTNALAWTNDILFPFPNLNSVAFVGGYFIAVGVNGAVLVSANGQNWSVRSVGRLSNLDEKAFGNGLFVVSGEGIFTSPDTVTWTERISPTGASLNSLTFGDGVFVAGGFGGGYIVSNDGISWRYSYPGYASFPQGMAFQEGMFVAVGARWSNLPNIWTSLNGSNWTQRSFDSGQMDFNDITVGVGTFVAVGNGGLIAQSSPLITGAPQVILVPTNRTVFSGSAVTFTATVYGSAPFAYQWLKNGTPISGATNAVLLLASLRLTDSGDYSVEVSNSFGLVTTAAGSLNVQEMGPPGLAIESYAGLTITGVVGRAYRIEHSTQIEAPGTWQTLTNLVLSTSPQIWIDWGSPQKPKRFYRALLLP